MIRPMTERGLPTEGAPACPFVAFEDDRDARSTVPDHRHRCFAEERPAPRALAHQEAYCLSSAFPVCPTFQDWARREAAAAKPTAVSATVPNEEAVPESHSMPPLEPDPQHLPAQDPQPIPPRRSPMPRDWAAPPPWNGDPAAAAAAGALGAAAATGYDDEGLDPVTDVPAIAPRPAGPGPAPMAPSAQPQGWSPESRGLAGSAAYRLAGPDPDEPAPAAPYADDDPDDWNAGAAATAAASTSWAASQPSRSAPTPAPGSARRPAPAPAPQAHPQQGAAGGPGRPPAGNRQEPAELFGPAWEAPRRYEAYPTLRTRVGLPSFGGVPRLGLAAAGLVLAALFVFFFGPMLLGFGKNDQPGAGAGATPTPSIQATDTPEPTVAPPPSPTVYIVVRNDTFSKIARKLGVTIEVLKAANPQIKNIDKIKIGDQINIPEAVQGGGASAQP